MEFYALDDKLTLGEHLLSYGADDSYAIYFLSAMVFTFNISKTHIDYTLISLLTV